MKKKITIVVEVETEADFDTIETAVMRGLDYGFTVYDVTGDTTDPTIRVENTED